MELLPFKGAEINKLKDYMSVAGPLGYSISILMTQTEETLNLRLAKFPQDQHFISVFTDSPSIKIFSLC